MSAVAVARSSPAAGPVRVTIDARWIFPQISGIGLYTRELIRGLVSVDRETAYTLLFDRAEVEERELALTGAGDAANFRAMRVPYGPFAPIGQVRMPGLLRGLGTEVFHSPNYMLPFLAFGRRGAPRAVVTIHDLIPLLFPHYTPRALKTRLLPVFRLVMREAARRASAIVVPSRSTADDVIRELRLPPSRRDRVVAIPEAAGAQFAPASEPTAAGRTILFVGRRDPYKNLPTLIRAFAAVRRDVPEARLVVVGPPDPRYPEAEQAAAESGAGGAIEWRGYVDGPGLIRAYHEAAVFALPSRYEGFGLPVLEAMASGAPVVCGNRSSLPEIAGDAAVLVDPDSVDAIATALVDVLRRPDMAAGLRARGLRRAAEFSWAAAARATSALYRRIALEGR